MFAGKTRLLAGLTIFEKLRGLSADEPMEMPLDQTSDSAAKDKSVRRYSVIDHRIRLERAAFTARFIRIVANPANLAGPRLSYESIAPKSPKT